MWSLFRTPRWAIATLVVVALCVIFASLGQWQLRRHGERQIENTVNAARLAAAPEPLSVLLTAGGTDPDSLENRPVTAAGTFRPDEELLVRSQTANGQPGFHVVTPFTSDGRTVLVNRGWVPLAVEQPPVEGVPPPAGVVTVTGLLRKSQPRSSIGPVEPPGQLRVVARIDIERLREQFPDLAPLWIQQTDPVAAELPVRLPLPATDDPGSHLPYAVQWYSFALITAGGYAFLVRRALREQR